jgi:hypothetical protein
VLSDKQKRAQYDSQRQYSMGSDQPQSSYQYGPPRRKNSMSLFILSTEDLSLDQTNANRGPVRDDFEDILRFWNDVCCTISFV